MMRYLGANSLSIPRPVQPSACGDRTLQTLRQPPRQRGHAQIPTGGANALRAQHFFQEVPAILRHSRRRFDSSPTAGGGADHRSSVVTGARWSHSGAIQDALGGTPRTFLGAGNGPPPLPLPHLALRGRNPGPAPPNQPPLPSNADRGGTALSEDLLNWQTCRGHSVSPPITLHYTKRKEKIAKRFQIVLAEKRNLKEAAAKSRNNWKNEHK